MRERTRVVVGFNEKLLIRLDRSVAVSGEAIANNVSKSECSMKNSVGAAANGRIP